MLVEMEKARGLTQRDKFAIAALPVVMEEYADTPNIGDRSQASIRRGAAKAAYQMADALMEIRGIPNTALAGNGGGK